jgi:hypothetical protein
MDDIKNKMLVRIFEAEITLRPGGRRNGVIEVKRLGTVDGIHVVQYRFLSYFW